MAADALDRRDEPRLRAGGAAGGGRRRLLRALRLLRLRRSACGGRGLAPRRRRPRPRLGGGLGRRLGGRARPRPRRSALAGLLGLDGGLLGAAQLAQLGEERAAVALGGGRPAAARALGPLRSAAAAAGWPRRRLASPAAAGARSSPAAAPSEAAARARCRRGGSAGAAASAWRPGPERALGRRGGLRLVSADAGGGSRGGLGRRGAAAASCGSIFGGPTRLRIGLRVGLRGGGLVRRGLLVEGAVVADSSGAAVAAAGLSAPRRRRAPQRRGRRPLAAAARRAPGLGAASAAAPRRAAGGARGGSGAVGVGGAGSGGRRAPRRSCRLGARPRDAARRGARGVDRLGACSAPPRSGAVAPRAVGTVRRCSGARSSSAGVSVMSPVLLRWLSLGRVASHSGAGGCAHVWRRRAKCRCSRSIRQHSGAAPPRARVAATSLSGPDGDQRRRAPRAVPDRRQLAGLPGVLRAPGVDRDLRRAPDERDLRLRVDAREDPHRLRPGADRRGVGRGHVRPQGDLARLQGPALAAGPTCSSSSGRTCARSWRRSATATSPSRASRPTT